MISGFHAVQFAWLTENSFRWSWCYSQMLVVRTSYCSSQCLSWLYGWFKWYWCNVITTWHFHLFIALYVRETHSCITRWITLLDKVTVSVKPGIRLEVKLEHKSFSQIRLEILAFRSNSSKLGCRIAGKALKLEACTLLPIFLKKRILSLCNLYFLKLNFTSCVFSILNFSGSCALFIALYVILWLDRYAFLPAGS